MAMFSAVRTLSNIAYISVRKESAARTLSGHAWPVTAVQLQGDTAVTADSCTVRLWQLTTGAPLLQLEGPKNVVQVRNVNLRILEVPAHRPPSSRIIHISGSVRSNSKCLPDVCSSQMRTAILSATTWPRPMIKRMNATKGRERG